MVATHSRVVVDEDDLAKRLPVRLVQDLHGAFGEHHARAVHTKGIIVQGGFVPSREARELCRAEIFRQSTVPVMARFSNFTGLPDIPDTDLKANPRGFAVRFLMPDGSNLDIVNHSFNGFLVSTSEEFSEFLQALAGSGGEPTPGSPLEAFLASHPIAKNFITSQNRLPRSWATTSFFSVNAVQFTNDQGENSFVRYQFVPDAGGESLSHEEQGDAAPDYLFQEIKQRIAAGPISFTWYAQVAQDSDVIDDPAMAWPDDRRRVPLGTITIDQVGPNSPEADKALAFMPGTLPPGIEVADPMLTIRNASYPHSFQERNR
ncbi:catalase family peroxidase [Micromonospora sediminicola]|uniref:catalase family peroxidase n=1 Tax=Micromonospora sediminicola TaxID=946078 RepID=UPI00378DE840